MAKKIKKKYITEEDQKVMLQLIDQFMIESKDGTQKTFKSDLIMNRLFIDYFDKIIIGIINSPQYKYYNFYEVDDLKNVARMKIYESIIKKQYKKEIASPFNFYSTVVSNNLFSFTTRESNKRKHINDFVEIEKIFNDSTPTYHEDFDKKFLFEFIFEEIDKFFQEKPRFLELAQIFKEYFENNQGRKFIKKDFIEYARTFTFSDSFCNNFFICCKKIKSISKILNDTINHSDVFLNNNSAKIVLSSKNINDGKISDEDKFWRLLRQVNRKRGRKKNVAKAI